MRVIGAGFILFQPLFFTTFVEVVVHKIWHVVVVAVIAFACIYASNNVKFISNIVG